MELFKNTNYDFLGKKWPFIIASLVLTVAGFASILMQGGLKFGIDFKGGTLMTVKFAQKPPIEKIRSAFSRSGKIKGEVSVQNFTDPQTQNEIEIGTELVNEKQLAANRQAMEEVLADTFAQPGSGKLDLNSASKESLAARLRDPLAAGQIWRDAAKRIVSPEAIVECEIAAADVAINDLAKAAAARPLLDAATTHLGSHSGPVCLRTYSAITRWPAYQSTTARISGMSRSYSRKQSMSSRP